MISVILPTVRPEGIPIVQKALDRQTYQDYELIIASPEGSKPEGLYWTIYRDYNRAIKKAKGDLIVSWQDYTFSDATTLERFHFHFNHDPQTIVGAVGNKYTDDSWTVETWKDPRIKDEGYYECPYNYIELNLCAFPKKALYDVGGFDEYLDKYSSCCGLDVLDRLDIKGGWRFKIDESIRSYSLEHGRLPMWEENNPFLNGAYNQRRRTYLENPTLNYLV